MNVLLFAGLLLVAWAASRAYAQETPRGEARDPRTGARPCDLSASQIAERSGEQLRIWLNCPGRLNTEVQALANILYATDPGTAGAVLDRWRARRSVETATPDGTVNPEARRAVEGAVQATERELRGPGYAPTPLRGVERDAQGGRLGRPAPPQQLPPATVESTSPTPAYYNPNLARRQAGPLSRHVAQQGTNYDRSRVRAFQRAAGFTDVNQHGLYDCMTHNALSHYGIQSPPRPLLGIAGNCAQHPYVPPRPRT